MLAASMCPTCGQLLSSRLFTPDEMAADLAIPRARLMHAARTGRVPRVEISAHCIRFNREAVRAALEKRQERLPRAGKGRQKTRRPVAPRLLEQAGLLLRPHRPE